MSRIQAKTLEQIPEFAEMMEKGSMAMGFLPEDALIMAHCPDMLRGAGHFINAILGNGTVDAGLKRIIGYMTSQASGCHYCSAHTSYTALKNGITEEKFAAIWNYPTSPLFSKKEKAVMDFAVKASSIPNACTDADFDNLKNHFNTEEIVEIVFTISMYAFLNKFNDTLKTSIEEKPLEVYQKINQSYE